jgi:hypothetical protein
MSSSKLDFIPKQKSLFIARIWSFWILISRLSKLLIILKVLSITLTGMGDCEPDAFEGTSWQDQHNSDFVEGLSLVYVWISYHEEVWLCRLRDPWQWYMGLNTSIQQFAERLNDLNRNLSLWDKSEHVKSKFFAEQIEYLVPGYWITRQGIQPLRNNVETILNNIEAP